MGDLQEAKATATTLDKLLKWGAVTLALGAIAWARHMTVQGSEQMADIAKTRETVQNLEKSLEKLSKEHTETNNKQDGRLSDLEKSLAQMLGAQTNEQLGRLLSAVSQQGERLARIEAKLEQK